ncbi:MAG: urea transporter [Myxococcales bacterium]|nr:urea transporter [Myxococcales bacterium]
MALILPVLRTYAAVLFGRSPWVGGLLLAATLSVPSTGLHGLLAALWALGAARALRLPEGAVAEGLYGYNALLVGLAVGSLYPLSPLSLALAVGHATLAVGLTAALQSLLPFPPLTLPFLAGFWLLLPMAPTSPLPPEPGLATLAALFFGRGPVAGGLVALAVVVWSRQGAVLGAVGLLVAAGLRWGLGGVDPLLGVNLALVAMAVGGVWMVPSRASVALAAVAAALTGLLAVGLGPAVARLGLPLSILPFNLGVALTLLALRRRSEDRGPKAVDAVPGTPEQNLAFHLTRTARFGARYAVRFRAPVLGVWEVTQGEGDGPTHLDAWRHAIDLEVRGADGSLHANAGHRAEDYRCYRLPVLAAADGTVVTVVDGVRDNPVGEVDLDDNWGNVVVLYHAPGLYSLVAHLAPGSIEVHEGQRVRQGDPLGRCGSSGRSPRPHLHFQLQGSATVGAPTLPLELHDVVDVERGVLRGAFTPVTGDRLRNLAVDPDLADALALRPGLRWDLAGADGPAPVVCEVDVTGVPGLAHAGGRMLYAQRDDLLTLFAPLAEARSPLHVLRAAMPRVPFEAGVRFRDHLPPDAALPLWKRPLHDVFAMFVETRGTPVDYEVATAPGGWVLRGSTEEGDLRTEAVIRRGVGPVELALTTRASSIRLTRDLQETP